jgi:integrase/recombinase XerD
MSSSGVESWTVVGSDRRPVEPVDEFLVWLTGIERSPNTVEAYARDLGLFWSFLDERGVPWDRVSVAELGEFAAWARRPAPNVLVLSEQAAKRSASTVNRMLAALVSFYEFHGRRGNELARDLVGPHAQWPRRVQAVSAWDRSRPAAGSAGAAAGAPTSPADVELGAGRSGDRLPAAAA